MRACQAMMEEVRLFVCRALAVRQRQPDNRTTEVVVLLNVLVYRVQINAQPAYHEKKRHASGAWGLEPETFSAQDCISITTPNS